MFSFSFLFQYGCYDRSILILQLILHALYRTEQIVFQMHSTAYGHLQE